MASGRFIAFVLSLGLLAGVSAGCDGFDPSSFDMAGALGVGENTNLLSPPPPPPPKPKPTPTPTPVPQPSGPDPRDAYIKRNRSFDSLRSKGMTLVYDKKIPQAVGTFNQALSSRPNDRTTQLWLKAIRESREKSAAKTQPQGGVNQLPINPQYGYPQQAPAYGAPYGGQPYGGQPPYGAPPQLPPPAVPPAQQAPVDPRQVF